MITDDEFLQTLQTSIENNTITLPTLPEVALKVRDAVEQENTTAVQVAEMVATDAALSARLLQVANSPLYRGRVPIESIQMAITRLGNKMVRSLVISLAMKQIFQATSDAADKRLRKLWEESVQIAAISRVLSQSLSHLDKEQAMLAGLIHNIGCLPILTLAESYPDLIGDETRLDALIEKLNPIIGKQILKAWDFSDALIAVPENYQNLAYDGGDKADYVDIVQVARLQTLDAGHVATAADWFQVPAFRKVGVEPEVEVINIEGVAEDLEEIQAVFL
ncbi:MAG: HDOD domain-containing protein [Gammaproteobacteria bacterium]|nr:HDOD domain-containing protein [Gammaproteobacteria bacterium]